MSARPTSTSSTSSACRCRSMCRRTRSIRLHPDDLLNLYVRSQDGQMVPIGAVAHLGPAGRAAADHALQSLSVRRRSSARPARGFSSGQAMAAMEADRQARPAERRRATNGRRCRIRRRSPATSSTTCSACRCCWSISCLAGRYEKPDFAAGRAFGGAAGIERVRWRLLPGLGLPRTSTCKLV